MILYFSGTGNSLLVARLLSERLDEPLRPLLEVGDEEVRAATSVGFVFPIYAWGLPRVVRRRIMGFLTLPSWAWMVCTCGDDIGLTHRELQSLLQTKGCTLSAAFSLQLPNTYVGLPGFDVDTPQEQARRLSEATAKTEEVAAQLRTLYAKASATAPLEILSVVEGVFPWFKSRVLRPFFHRFLVGDSRFRSTEACIHCRQCERVCPMHNIRMDNAVRPLWQGNCADCYACYHVCPTHAIRYGRWTKGKGQKKVLR